MSRFLSVYAVLAVMTWSLTVVAQPAEADDAEEVEVVQVVAPVVVEAVAPSVSTRYGSVRLLGVFQSLMDFRIPPSGVDDATLDFSLQRARLILSGHVVSENLQYFFQGDATNRGLGSFVLDAAMTYRLPDFGLAIKVGRFVPDFSIMMPRNTADLGMINYPLYLTAGNFTLWRQNGVEFSWAASSDLSVTLGAFNGMMIEPTAALRVGGVPNNTALYMPLLGDVGIARQTNNADNNNLKDILLRVAFRPMPGFSLGLHGWLGFPRAYSVAANADGDGLVFMNWAGERNTSDMVFQGGLSAEYRQDGMHIAGEVMARMVAFESPMAINVVGVTEPTERVDSLMSLGAWLHFGYLIDGWLEPVVRVDWLEPIMDDAFDSDQVLRFTVGPQFWLEEGNHFRILVNYFMNLHYQNDARDPDHNAQVQFQALW